MLTTKSNIKNTTSPENRKLIEHFQKLYSIAFRKMYSNMDLLEDPNFISDIILNYAFTVKNYEYLVNHVKTKFKQEESIKKNTRKEIEELTNYIRDEEKKKKGRDLKKIKKIQKKISRKLKSLNQKITFGLKSVARDITRQSQALELIDKIKDKKLYEEKLAVLNKNKELFQENRIMMMIFIGEAARNGNRYVDIKGLSKGKVVFKYNKHEIELKFKITSKKQQKLYEKIELLAMDNELPLTIGISKDELHITYEEGKINGKFFDEKKFYKSISHIEKGKDRKEIIRNAHKEHEEKCFTNKITERYCAIDKNPAGIGWALKDKLSDAPEGEFKIVRKGFINFELLNDKSVSSNKRKHEIAIAVSDFFIMLEHHKVCNFVEEDLDFGNNTDHGNKESNRKINNVWLRTYIDKLTTKWCAYYGMKKIPIHPAWSSFIGNINYNTYDPIAAAIEIGRRGIVKYIKGGHWIPSFHKGVITESLLHGNNDKMDYDKLANASSWKEAYSLVSTAGMSVRRADREIYPFTQFKQNRTDKSKVTTLIFL